MRAAALLLLLAGCNTDAGRFLTPDEFHLWAAHIEGDSVGTLGSSRNPSRFQTVGSGDSNTIGGGFTWHLTVPAYHAPPHREHFAPQLPYTPPVLPVTPSQDPEPTPGPEEPEPAPEEPEEPEHDEDVPHATDWYVRLASALGLFLTALAGYLGRQRIPYVREWTKEGRRRRESSTCEDDSEDPPPII